MKTLRSALLAITALAFCGSGASAQGAARRAAERDMLKRAVEIPTVKGRGQMDEMTAMLSAELRKAGIRDIVIKKHGDTESLIARWRADRPLVVSPRFAEGFGHPILLDGSLVQELREVDEATLGLRGVIDMHLNRAVSVAVANDAVNVDLNTPADYEAAKAAYESGSWREI